MTGRGPRDLARHLMARTLRTICGSVVGVRTEDRVAALTFDDGPDPEGTPAVLDALARAGMKGTFFMVGERAARHPELVARVRAEGHEIGNHTWDHPSLPQLPGRSVADQLALTQDALRPHEVRLMRPPYGHQTLGSYIATRRQGLTPVLWTGTADDWRGLDGETVAERILAGLRPGGILLLHDSLCTFAEESHRDRGPVVEALGIVAARRPDWRFVTVSDLLAAGRPETAYWVRRGKASWLARQKRAAPAADTPAPEEAPAR